MRSLVKGAMSALLTPIVGVLYCLFLIARNVQAAGGVVSLRLRSGQIVPVRVIRGVRGLPPGARAITFGRTILTAPRFPSSSLLRHELAHVEQYERYGFVGFLVRYGFDAGSRGYENSILEREARAAE